MQNITPCLWFDDQAEEAVRFYLSVFKNSKILEVTHYTEGSPGKPGSVLTIKFRILGQEFLVLNGGPEFKLTPAISFIVNCRTQTEVNYYWRRLSAGGKKIQCGWLEDKFGVSWQIVPTILSKLLSGKDTEKATRVLQAVMKMNKLDIKRLQRAAAK